MQIAMIGDRIVKTAKLEPVYMDRGTYFGDGVYEVLRSYNGKIFALEQHLSRLANSLAGIGIRNVDINDVRRRILTAFESAGLPDAKIYFHITRGSAPRNHTWDSTIKPNFFLTIEPAPDDTQDKANGTAVCTQPDLRWKRCDIKSLNLLPNILARQAAEAKGCQEAILVDESGLITEGSGSAFFAIIGRTVQTAPLTANILPSITRAFILKAAKNLGMDTLEESLTPQKAASADELFIAVTTKDIVPVVRFDDKTIGDGTPGKRTKTLIEAFRKFTT